MTLKTRVAVCGSSLYMAGLAASLQANPNVEVVRIPANTVALSEALDELALAAVAFDLDEIPGDLAISLLRNRPGLTLIGADPSSDRLLLLSGRQEQPVSAAELLQAIPGGIAGGSQSSIKGPRERSQEQSYSQDDSNDREHND